MTPKFSTTYRNIKTGKVVRTYSEEMHKGYRAGRIGFHAITEAGEKKGPILGSSHENFLKTYVEVGA